MNHSKRSIRKLTLPYCQQHVATIGPASGHDGPPVGNYPPRDYPPHYPPRRRPPRCGAMLVLIALMMIGFMVTVAFSVDIAHMHLTRTELRTATDAASKAAAATLAETMNRNQAIKRGREIAAANSVNSEPLRLSRHNFQFGNANPGRSGKFQFKQGGRPFNTVRVTGKRDKQSLSGAVPLFFGGLTGVELFETESTAAATYIERDVVLVVDRSGSMQGGKFRDLISAIKTFTETLNDTPVDEYVGLASYSEYGATNVRLTANLQQINRGIQLLKLGGWTSISRGMAAGNRIMEGGRDAKFVERTMIVMTDGRHNRGPDPELIARRLNAEGIMIHTITFGHNADQKRMKDVARIGGGRHYHANNGIQLKKIYREIALTLSTIMTQ